jgi:transcriptional regulator with XRE-family HTH domain
VPSPPPYSGAQQARAALGARLGELRAAASLTGRELARRCGWHESKASRIEHGKTTPSAEDITAWAACCGAPELTDDLIASLHAVEGMWVEWQRMRRAGMRHAVEHVRPLWERTRQFRVYGSWMIPGAVQTAGYTRAVLATIARQSGLSDDVEDAVAARTDRLRMLREGGRTFAVLIEESVLRSIIGDVNVMAGQLGHLLTVMALPAVSLGIVPMGIVRTRRWPVEDFWIFDDAQASVELVSGWLTVTHPRDVELYSRAFSDLGRLAVYGGAARGLITAALQALPPSE